MAQLTGPLAIPQTSLTWVELILDVLGEDSDGQCIAVVGASP